MKETIAIDTSISNTQEVLDMRHPAEDFFDELAELYDPAHRNRDLGDETFYRELATSTDGPVLEVGCGTGRIYLELLRAGVDADGFDISSKMLEVLEAKATTEGLEPTVWKADMRSFETSRAYSLVIIPFRTFLHNISLEDQLATLEHVYAALEPGGTLALNFFTPDFDIICNDYGSPDTWSFTYEGAQYQVTDVTDFIDEVDQIVASTRRVTRGDEEISQSTFELAMVSKRHFELLLHATGWSDWTVEGGFDGDDLVSTDQEQVWTVTK